MGHTCSSFNTVETVVAYQGCFSGCGAARASPFGCTLQVDAPHCRLKGIGQFHQSRFVLIDFLRISGGDVCVVLSYWRAD